MFVYLYHMYDYISSIVRSLGDFCMVNLHTHPLRYDWWRRAKGRPCWIFLASDWWRRVKSPIWYRDNLKC